MSKNIKDKNKETDGFFELNPLGVFNKPINSIEELKLILKHDKDEYKTPKKINFDKSNIPKQLKNGKVNKPINSIEELKLILKYDGDGREDPLEGIVGIIKTDEITDSVKLKKDSYKRGR